MTYRDLMDRIGIGERVHLVYIAHRVGDWDVAVDVYGVLVTVRAMYGVLIAWIDDGRNDLRPCLLRKIVAAQRERSAIAVEDDWYEGSV